MCKNGSNLYMHYVSFRETIESNEINIIFQLPTKKSTEYTPETIATFFSDFYAQFPSIGIPCSGFIENKYARMSVRSIIPQKSAAVRVLPVNSDAFYYISTSGYIADYVVPIIAP